MFIAQHALTTLGFKARDPHAAQEPFWQLAKPRMSKDGELEDFRKVALEAAAEYLKSAPEEPTGE